MRSAGLRYDIAGAESQSVEVADDGADDDFGGEAQVGDHAANDGDLGGILLAEECAVGLGGDEQLGIRRWRRRESGRGGMRRRDDR